MNTIRYNPVDSEASYFSTPLFSNYKVTIPIVFMIISSSTVAKKMIYPHYPQD